MIAALVVVIAMVAGCGGRPVAEEDPTSTQAAASRSSSPTLSPSPSLTQEELDVEAAKQAYLDFIEHYNEVWQNGFSTDELIIEAVRMQGRTVDTARGPIGDEISSAVEHGISREGESIVESLTVVGYNPANRDVTLEVCMDVSGVHTLRDGVRQLEGERNDSPVLDVRMATDRGGEHAWLVASSERRDGFSC